LSATGFNSLEGAIQNFQVIWAMRVVDFMFPALAILAAIWLVSKRALMEERDARLPFRAVEKECGGSSICGQEVDGLLSSRLR
jgi:hypothetical protein